MNEIYWLTRLDAINTAIAVLMAVSIIVCLVSTLVAFIHPIIDNGECVEAKRLVRISIIPAIIFSLLLIFIPSKKDAFMIWGVGGVVDYVKESETIKQLPDKTIKIFDEWLNSITNEEKENRYE